MQEETVQLLESTLFTTSRPDAKAHTCVVVFDKTHAVSFRHGQHSSFAITEPVTLYNVLDSSMTVEVFFSNYLN